MCIPVIDSKIICFTGVIFAIKLFSDFFHKVQISINYNKIILKFVVLSNSLVPFCPLKGKSLLWKRHILESKSGMSKWSLACYLQHLSVPCVTSNNLTTLCEVTVNTLSATGCHSTFSILRCWLGNVTSGLMSDIISLRLELSCGSCHTFICKDKYYIAVFLTKSWDL